MENIIEVKNISKTIGKRKILKDVSFQIEKGSITGFLGPNGAGKTTTIRILTGLIANQGGKVLINGVSIDNKQKALKSVGAIVETPIFFNYLTGEENLRALSLLDSSLDKVEREKRIKEVLTLVGLMDRRNDKVKGYSLGMKQRLGIAQALLNNPEILILDEPSNGLDPLGMKELRELILKLNKDNGMTILISSHLLDELQQICTDYIMIHKGEIKWKGHREELMNEWRGQRLEDAFISIIRGEKVEGSS